MFEDDWLHRQVDEVARAIARALGMASAQECAEALQRAGREAFGVDSRLALAIGTPDLRALLRDPERVRAFARLLAAEATVAPDPARAEALRLKARELDPSL